MELMGWVIRLRELLKSKAFLVSVVLLLLTSIVYMRQNSYGFNFENVSQLQTAFNLYEYKGSDLSDEEYPSYVYEDVAYFCQINREHVDGYGLWLENILTDDPNSIISILGKNNSYAIDNKAKTQKDYSRLKGLKLELEPRTDYQMQSILNCKGLEWILLLWVSFLCISTYRERDSLLQILRFSTRDGRGKVALYELIRIWFQVTAFILILNIVLIALSIFICGKNIAWDIPAQSIPSLGQLDWKLSLKSFFLIYVLVQCLGCCMLAAFFTFLLWFWDHYLIAFSIFSLVMGVEYLLLNQISLQSRWNVLLFVNCWNAVEPTFILSAYRNLRMIRGTLINGRSLMFVSTIIFTVICTTVSVYLSSVKREMHYHKLFWGASISQKICRIKGYCESHFNYPALSVYYFLICKRGLIIGILALLLFLSIPQPIEVYYSPEMGYVKAFYHDWEGELEEDLEEWQIEEGEILAGWKQEFSDARKQYNVGEIGLQEYQQAYMSEEVRKHRYQAYEIICEEIAELRAYSIETGRKVWITDSNTLEHLFGQEDKRMWIIITILAISIQLLIIGILFSEDELLMRIFRSTQYGTEYSFLERTIQIELYSLCTITAIWLVWCMYIRGSYGSFDYTVPVQSFRMFREINWNISLGQFLMILWMWSVLMNSLIVGIHTLMVLLMGRGGIVICMIMSIGPLLIHLMRYYIPTFLDVSMLFRWDWMEIGFDTLTPLTVLLVLKAGIWGLAWYQWRRKK